MANEIGKEPVRSNEFFLMALLSDYFLCFSPFFIFF